MFDKRSDKIVDILSDSLSVMIHICEDINILKKEWLFHSNKTD